MESAIPQGKLAEIVRAARSRTGVPAVAAGLPVDGKAELVADGPVEVDTPFRIASITKWFTASLAGFSATVNGGSVTERETDRLTGGIIEQRYRPSFGVTLMSHRIDFPRPGVARVGWIALPRVGG